MKKVINKIIREIQPVENRWNNFRIWQFNIIIHDTIFYLLPTIRIDYGLEKTWTIMFHLFIIEIYIIFNK